jgi:hypothetical protein
VLLFVMTHTGLKRSFASFPVAALNIRFRLLIKRLVKISAYVIDVLELFLTDPSNRLLVVCLQLNRRKLYS